jgi:ferredoxin
MKASVDQDSCIGCGLCCGLEPSVFFMNDSGKAEACTEIPKGSEDEVQQAGDTCPVGAISIE